MFSRILVLAAVSAILVLSISVHADPIDDYIQAHMRRNHIPGVSVAVVRSD